MIATITYYFQVLICLDQSDLKALRGVFDAI